jgi:phosphoenolpyruvate carboxykinase (ATP)
MNNVGYRKHSIFGAEKSLICPGAPNVILSPRETWRDDLAFYK